MSATSPASRQAEHGQDVDLIQSPRSTGSILKPFLYAAMLQEGGLTPRTLVADTPVHFSGYIPENFDRRFRGAVPARDALAWSLNIPAIRMLQQYGIPRFYNLLKKWGMTTLTRPPGGYGLTLILGGAEGTLYQITRMYAGLVQLAMADAGKRNEIRLLPNDKFQPLPMKDLGPAAAFLTLEALTEVNRPDQEGFWKQFNSSKWVAWKTGTSFGLRDAWSVGMTPAYTVGVWAGNADGEGNPNLTGLSTSAPVLFDILQVLDTGGAIPAPNLWLQEITVCRDSGFLATDLCPAVTVAMPRESHFTHGCPYHQLIHLEPEPALSGSIRAANRSNAWSMFPGSSCRRCPNTISAAITPNTAPCRPYRPDCADIDPGRERPAGHEPGLSRGEHRRLYSRRPGRQTGPGDFRGHSPPARDRHLLAHRRPLCDRHPPVPPGHRRPGAGPAPAGADRRGRPAPGAPFHGPQPQPLITNMFLFSIEKGGHGDRLDT